VGLPPRCVTPPIFPHRWVPAGTQPVCTQPAYMPVAPVYATDCIPVASTQTVPALSMPLQSVCTRPAATQPAVTLAMPVQCVHTQRAATQPTATLARPLYAPSMPMHTVTAYTHGPTAPVVPVSACTPTMPMHLVSDAAPTQPVSAMTAVHECTPPMSLHPRPGPVTPMTECTLAVPNLPG